MISRVFEGAFREWLLPRRRTPVDHLGDGCGRSVDDGYLDQKALPVSRDRELITDQVNGESSIEQRPRNARIHGRLGSNVHRHDPAVETQIEKLLAVAPPSRLGATVGRALTLLIG